MRYMVILIEQERDGHGSGKAGSRQLASGRHLAGVITAAIAELRMIALHEDTMEQRADAWARKAITHLGAP